MIEKNLKSLIRRYPVAVVLNFTGLVAALLVAGLSGCDKQLIPEINLADNLEGSWEKAYPEGVQDAGLVIWAFSTINKESQDPFILTIYVSDVFSGDSEAKYIYQQHQNGYPGIDSKKIARFKESNPRIFNILRKHVSRATAYRYDQCLYSKPLSFVIEVALISSTMSM